MTTQPQPQNSFPVSSRTVLVGPGVARMRFGGDADAILAKIEAGQIQWAFDISATGARKRQWRVWIKELIVPEQTSNLNLGEALAEILGTRNSFPRGEIEVRWVLSHVHLIELLRLNELALVGKEISAASLKQFLTRRWSGAGIAAKPATAQPKTIFCDEEERTFESHHKAGVLAYVPGSPPH